MNDKSSLHTYTRQGSDEAIGVSFYCPGCKGMHAVPVKPDPDRPNGPVWTWNGAVGDGATLSPSLLIRFTNHADCMPPDPCRLPNCKGKTHVCHLFIRNGMIEFLSDCTHDHVSKVVPIPPWPADW